MAFLSSRDANKQPNDKGDCSTEQAGMKRVKHCDSGFDQAWKNEFTWVHVDKDEEGQCTLCSLCCKHNQTTKRMVWIELPCRLFRRDNG